MIPYAVYLGVLLGGYLIGSVPFGLLIARSRGVDIRAVGSGNIGATNVFRSVGKPWGITTFALDMLKGLLPTLVPLLLLSESHVHLGGCMLTGGVAAILGHSFSCFLKFTGGKGVATSAGVVLGLAPWLVLIGLGTWILLLLVSRMVSLSSIGAAFAIAGGSWWLRPGGGIVVAIALSLLAILVLIRHHGNLRRIFNGTERKVSFKKS